MILSREFAYSGTELRTEAVSGVYNKVITRSRTINHPAPGQPASFEVRSLEAGTSGQPSADYSANYQYDYTNGGRLGYVAGPGLVGDGVAYSYKPGTNLVQNVSYNLSPNQVLGVTTRTYEAQRPLTNSVENNWNIGGGQTTTISRYAHDYDQIGRRKYVVRAGSAFSQDHLDLWGYNERSELTSSEQHQGTDPGNPGSLVAGRKLTYVYDNIGNRKTFQIDSATPTTYFINNQVNQYSSTSQPAESFTYDADGNMINDGGYSYTWDGENRLIAIQPKPSLLAPGSKRIESSYDHMGRRVRKAVKEYNGSSWATVLSDRRFVYDGWNVIMELDGLDHDSNGQPDNTVIRKFTWGLDLSGSIQGAGGIGGLLAAHDTQGTATTADDKDYAYFYDANGNVGQVIDVTASVLQPATIAAKYEYDPYGQSLLDPSNAAVSGPYAAANPFRFSTKYCDSELATGTTEDVYYYGYRYYSPRLGRWISRDPVYEEVFANSDGYGAGHDAWAKQLVITAGAVPDNDGWNLFGFVRNEPLGFSDPLGLKGMRLARDGPGYLGGPCGRYAVAWFVYFPRLYYPKCDGYLIQRVEVRARCAKCEQNLPAYSDSPDLVYWEAIPIKKGDDRAKTDYATWQNTANSRGRQGQFGAMRFFCESVTGKLNQQGWTTGTVGILPRCMNLPFSSGSFLHTTQEPAWWKTGKQDTNLGQVSRTADADWDCCCRPYKHKAWAQP